MAEGIFNLICEKGNLPHRASSCGIAAFSCAPASRYAIVAAKELGVDVSSHCSRQISSEICAGADMIYCMSEQHAKAVLSVCPNACDKIFVFNPPVPDPFGGGIDEYRNCAASLEKAIEKLIADIGVRK
jgi:protein-tyrosine-phosphatase